MRFSSVVSVGSESQLGSTNPQMGGTTLQRVDRHHLASGIVEERWLDLIGLTRQSMDGDVEGRGRLKVRPFIT